jgi:hypothetical protein
MPEHFYCQGSCEGVSKTAGVCENPDCDNYKNPLTSCDCEDKVHHVAEDDDDDNDEE